MYAECLKASGHSDLCNLDCIWNRMAICDRFCIARSGIPFCCDAKGEEKSCDMPASVSSSSIINPVNAPPPSVRMYSTS